MYRVQMDLIDEAQADEIVEHLLQAIEEAEITFQFDIFKIPLEDDDANTSDD